MVRGDAVVDAGTTASIGDLKDDDDQAVILGPATDEELSGGSSVEYDWTEEWYPLYLTRDVPEDAPLGLTVFDKQLVLYRDGTGELRCHEDRCPHRYEKNKKRPMQVSNLRPSRY